LILLFLFGDVQSLLKMKFRGDHFKKENKYSGSPKDWSQAGKKHKAHGSGSNVLSP
jgi:hypothetical protein